MADIPIVVVAYNRLGSLKRILSSLLRAEYPQAPVNLILSIDRGENGDVLGFAQEFQWPYGEKTVIYQKKNLGLKRHILTCGDLTREHDGILLLEDDLVVSPDFYRYAQECFAFVQGKDRIAGVALYNHRLSQLTEKVFEPLEDGWDNWYFRYACSWGQLWTRHQWALFREWLGEHEDYDFTASSRIPDHIKDWGQHSWLKYHIAFCIETDRLFLYPRVARTTCFSDPGVNFCESENTFQVPLMLANRPGTLRLSKPEESMAVYDQWMENTKLAQFLQKDVCVDLYGSKTWFEGKPYLLTSSQVEGAEEVASYGRQMRPQEWNVLAGVPGREIHLYRLTKDARKTDETRLSRANDALYYIRGISYPYKKAVLTLFLQETGKKIRRRLTKR